jgi:predicted nucleic acid-binding protein
MTASMNSSRALVDTNVVVYAYDVDEPLKHDRARDLLRLKLVFKRRVGAIPRRARVSAA